MDCGRNRKVLRNWRKYQVTVPEGERGRWRIKRQHVSMRAAIGENMRNRREASYQALLGVFGAERVRQPPLVMHGDYTALVHVDDDYVEHCWMSDQYPEIEEHRLLFSHAHGHVLITGLGIGMCARAVARKRAVRSVTVVEKSQEVVELVAGSLSDLGNLRVVVADAFSWQPDRKYNVAWHDIWRDKDADNVEQMNALERRYMPFAWWQECWDRDWCERRAATSMALAVMSADPELQRMRGDVARAEARAVFDRCLREVAAARPRTAP